MSHHGNNPPHVQKALSEALRSLLGEYPDGRMNANDEGAIAFAVGVEVLADCPRAFDALREYLRGRDIEGVVWHHPDGRMVKIKGKDFGLKRAG